MDTAPAAHYAWIVDHTMTLDDNDDTKLVEDTEDSDNGTTGPHNAPAPLLDRLAKGEGRAWRTLYDVDYTGHPADQRICHTGRYIDWLDLPDLLTYFPGTTPIPEIDADTEFGPLDDFSRGQCGAVEIQYRQEDGTWKTL
jgi:hypothetical protein